MSMMYMDNLMTYLKWRGDLVLSAAAFNEIDSLILSELVYLDFDGIVPKIGEEGSVTVPVAADAYRKRHLCGLSEFDYSAREEMLLAMAESRRFSEMTLEDYACNLDTEQQTQFAAMHVNLKNSYVYIAYRGTDTSITGWRENFNMSYMMPVPAQQSAVDYLNRTAAGFFTKYWLGGHSKGGNLAVYAATFCEGRIQKKIQEVHTFDSPGFSRKMEEIPEYQFIGDRIRSFVPQGSVVGMLMEHCTDYCVVESEEHGILQHDAFSWHVSGPEFVHAGSRNEFSRFMESTINSALLQIDHKERKQFSDAFFQVLEEAGIHQFTELTATNPKGLFSLVRAMTSVSPENRELIVRILRLLWENSQ